MSRSFFDKDNGMDAQIKKLNREGKTVFVSTGVWKVRMSDSKTLCFNEFFRADADNGRPIIDGGFYATDDAAEIAHLKGLRDLRTKVFEPEVVEVVADPDIKPLAKAK